VPTATAADPQRRAPSDLDAEALVRRHQQGLWRYLRALGAPPELAEDVMQDAFLVALQRLDVDGGDAAVAAFLRRTARHLFLRRRRDLGRREQILVEVADRLWQRHAADDGGEEWIAALRACVQRLSGRARAAIDHFYGEDRGRDGTAAVLGMQPNGVRTLLQRTRALLRACIEQRLGGER